jgi:hypothetical protein
VKKALLNLINKLPYIRSLYSKVKVYDKGFPPGHFYSPIVDTEEIRKYREQIFNSQRIIKALDINFDKQFSLLKQMFIHYQDIPFSVMKKDGFYYYYDNATYSYSDAIFLFLIMREFKPERIIEVGSGFSSSVMVDTNNHFFNGKIELQFIEPFPYHLEQAFGNQLGKLNLIQKKVQDIPIEFFNKLIFNDILFIDSTHVSKTGSDVNYLLFEVLPSLNQGTLIHIHDVFYPFEYPENWVMDKEFHNNGFGWNEIYLLRAFLMYNDSFEIISFNTLLEYEERDWFKRNMPLCLLNEGGSIWLRKVK